MPRIHSPPERFQIYESCVYADYITDSDQKNGWYTVIEVDPVKNIRITKVRSNGRAFETTIGYRSGMTISSEFDLTKKLEEAAA